VMSDWAGRSPEPASMADIGRRLRDLGPGSSAVVGFDRADTPGHWFNAVNHEGTVLAVDGQAARFEEQPPSRTDSASMRAACLTRMPSTSPRTGRWCGMITSDEATRIATEAVSPATAGDGQGWSGMARAGTWRSSPPGGSSVRTG
jgi:hypothetical protein